MSENVNQGRLTRGLIDLSDDDLTEDSIDIAKEFETLGVDEYEQFDYSDLFEGLDRPKLTLENSFFARILINSKLVVPQFQRNFAWDDDNHEQMWYNLREQILDLNDGTSGDVLGENFFGAIHVAEEDSDSNKLQVIDGQQRLATISILLNVLRQRLNGHIIELDGPVKEAIEYIKNQYVDQVIFDDSSGAGRARKLSIQLRGHDNDYFMLLFDDSPDRVLRIIEGLDKPKEGEEIRIDTLLNKLGISKDDIGNSIPDEKRYYAKNGSHNKLLGARDYYESAIDDLLDNSLELEEDAHAERAILMLNISQVILRSFRVIRSKLNETVDPQTKVQVFQSLNETGKSLTTAEKIRARIVASFNFNSPEVESWENITKLFGDDSSEIKKFLVDYLLAESDDYENRSIVKNNLLDAFSLSKKRDAELTSLLIEDENVNPEQEIVDLEQGAHWYKEVALTNLQQSLFQNNRQYEKTTQYLRRLESSSSQWMPFVFLLYSELANDDATMNGETLVKMMDSVENIMLRQSLSGALPTSIDTTFTASCSAFNKETVPATTGTSIEGLEEFNPLNRELLTELLLVNTNLEVLSGKTLVNALTYNSNWTQLKQVMVRLSIEELEESGSVAGRRTTQQETKLELDDLEIEHILPQKPTIADAEEGTLWLNKFFRIEAGEIPGAITESDLNSYDYVSDLKEANPATKRIHQTFIIDPGNTILLHKTINRKISNSPFAIKLLFYYLTQYKDLQATGEYLADLDNLDTSWDEIVELVESLSNSANLNSSELELLLSRLVSISSLSESDIDQIIGVSLSDDWTIEDVSEAAEEYSDIERLLNEYDLSEEDHRQLYNRDWNYYQFEETDDGIILSNEGEEKQYWEFLDDVVESILIKIKRNVDVTNEREVGEIVTTFNGKWTWTQMRDRKTKIVSKILKSLEFRSREIESEDLEEEKLRQQIESSLEM